MAEQKTTTDVTARRSPAARWALVGGTLLLAAVAVWVGSQSMRAASELRRFTASVRKVKTAISDGQQQLKEIIAERDAAMARQRAFGGDADVESHASIEPKTKAPASGRSAGRQPIPGGMNRVPTNPANSEHRTTDESTASEVSVGSAVKPPAMVDGAADEEAEAESSGADELAVGAKLPATRVVEGVTRRIKTGKSKSIVIVEGVAGDLSADDVVVSTRQGAGGIVPCDIVTKKGTTVWELRIAGKKVGKLGQSNATLVLEMPVSPGDSQWLMDYLVLELRPHGEGEPLVIPLGEPIEALLDVCDVSQSDAATIARTGRYDLFSDADSKARITRLLEEYPDLYESLEFKADDLSSVSGSVYRNGKSTPTFTLTDAGGIGVQFRRASVKPLNYQWNGLVFPLAYSLLNSKYKEVRVFNEALLAEIPLALQADINEQKNQYSWRGREALENAGRRDQASLLQAQEFPIASLRGRPVRLTLKKKGVDGGFIIVDSLHP